jgi:hypothetical protein
VETKARAATLGAVIFIEKEGFAPILEAAEAAQIAERFDVAIMHERDVGHSRAGTPVVSTQRITLHVPGLQRRLCQTVSHDGGARKTSGFSMDGINRVEDVMPNGPTGGNGGLLLGRRVVRPLMRSGHFRDDPAAGRTEPQSAGQLLSRPRTKAPAFPRVTHMRRRWACPYLARRARPRRARWVWCPFGRLADSRSCRRCYGP